MFSNLEFGFKLAVIGIPLVFLSLGAIGILFELLKRKFKAEKKVENKLFNKELAAAVIAAVYAASATSKKTLKFQKVELSKESGEWSSTPIWNLAGRLELTSRK